MIDYVRIANLIFIPLNVRPFLIESDSLNITIHMTIIILIHHPLAGLYILIASLKTLSSIYEHCQPDFYSFEGETLPHWADEQGCQVEGVQVQLNLKLKFNFYENLIEIKSKLKIK